jgi:hypothetical protein
MTEQLVGPLAAFDGAMGAPSVRPVAIIEIIEDATFTVLEFMFATVEAGQAAFTAPTYPATMKLYNVKRFQLATGSILVAFRS